MNRRLLVALVTLGLCAGCLGGPPADGDVGTTASGTDGTTTTAEQTTTVQRAVSISNSTAQKRALEAENAFVTARLGNTSGLGSWGVGSGTTSPNGTTLNRTAEGIYVRVKMPYYFSNGALEADSVSKATYRVNETVVVRVSGYDVSP